MKTERRSDPPQWSPVDSSQPSGHCFERYTCICAGCDDTIWRKTEMIRIGIGKLMIQRSAIGPLILLFAALQKCCNPRHIGYLACHKFNHIFCLLFTGFFARICRRVREQYAFRSIVRFFFGLNQRYVKKSAIVFAPPLPIGSCQADVQPQVAPADEFSGPLLARLRAVCGPVGSAARPGHCLQSL